MNRRAVAMMLAGLIVITVPLGALAGGRGKGAARQENSAQTRTGTRSGTQQRLRDGSCGTSTGGTQGSGAEKRKGNTYGPGDGTGNQGVRPQDGTGYGAASGN